MWTFRYFSYINEIYMGIVWFLKFNTGLPLREVSSFGISILWLINIHTEAILEQNIVNKIGNRSGP